MGLPAEGQPTSRVYLCVNADESEPGTFKDRQIIEYDPHLLIEGTLHLGLRHPSHTAYIYIRGEFALRRQASSRRRSPRRYASGHLGKNIFGTGFDLDI